MKSEETTSEPRLRDWVRRFQAAKRRHDQLVQSVEKDSEEHRRVDAEITDSYQAIRRQLRHRMEPKAKQSGIRDGIFDDIFTKVLSQCLDKVDPDSASLVGYFCRTLTNEINNHFRSVRKRKPLPWGMKSDDAGSDVVPEPYSDHTSYESTTDVSGVPAADANSMLQDPVAFRQSQLQRLRDDYALQKRTLIDSIRFNSEARLATLLADQRQRMAKVLSTSSHIRRDVAPLTEHCEQWTETDLRRDIESGRCDGSCTMDDRSLAAIWNAFSTRFQDAECSIDQKLMAAVICDCGVEVSHVAWRQRVRRYIDELQQHLAPDELKYFLL